jgi:hypothetical protein
MFDGLFSGLVTIGLIAGLFSGFVLFVVVPWLWEWIKPWLHGVTE